jgi:hypothetical protein
LEWRKRSNQFRPDDEKLEFASLEVLEFNGDNEYSVDIDDEQERAEEENAEVENQTHFLLNLQP